MSVPHGSFGLNVGDITGVKESAHSSRGGDGEADDVLADERRTGTVSGEGDRSGNRVPPMKWERTIGGKEPLHNEGRRGSMPLIQCSFRLSQHHSEQGSAKVMETGRAPWR